MKVLIASFYNQSLVNHFAADLEIADSHLENGDEVEFFTCLGKLTCCLENWAHRENLCQKCIANRSGGFTLLAKKCLVNDFNSYLQADDIAKIEDFCAGLSANIDDIEGLKKIYFEGFDIGMAALSTIYSFSRRSKISLDDSDKTLQSYLPNCQNYRDFARILIFNAARIFLSVKNFLHQNNIDRVYVFNGRLALMRAVFRAAQSCGVEYYAHDRGCDSEHYSIYPNCLPHSIANFVAQAEKKWQAESNHEAKIKKAEQFFSERRFGIIANWRSFTKYQNQQLLPKSFSENNFNLAIYNSSEDEFAVIGEEWSGKFYENQLSLLRQISSSITKLPELPQIQGKPLMIYLRIHPNLSGTHEIDELYKLESNFFKVISPDSKISSYALLDASDRILTFGSTMGIEAEFWGKPSILAGITFYGAMGACHQAKSHQELMELILAQDLPAKSPKIAQKYGFYQRTFGEKYRYWQQDENDLFTGTYHGKNLATMHSQHSLVTRLKNRSKKIINRF